MSTVSSASFATAFYDKDDQGVEVLMNKLRQAKQTLTDVQSLFAQRASIEEEYGKKLLKLSKASLGRDETGTLQNALVTVQQELEFAGRSHLELAALIRTQLEQATIEFLATQKEQRRRHTSIIERSMRSKALHTSSMLKAKERYEAEYMRANGTAPQRTGGVNSMMSKLNIIGQGSAGPRNPESDYQEACQKLHSVTQRFESDWGQACDRFQVMEEERIEFMRNIFWSYTNIYAGVCVTDDESYERVRQSLEQCDIDHDIAVFVEVKGVNHGGAGVPSVPIDGVPPHGWTGHGSATEAVPPNSNGSSVNVHAANHALGQSSGLTGEKRPPHSGGTIGSIDAQQNAFAPNSTLPPSQSGGYPPMATAQMGGASTEVRPGAAYPPESHTPSLGGTVQSAATATASVANVQTANTTTSTSTATATTTAASTLTTATTTTATAAAAAAATVTTASTTNSTGSGAAASTADGGRADGGFLVKAIYDYEATLDEEISFKEGQIIRVLATQLDGWWEGELEEDGVMRRGQFPSNFIEPLIF